MNNLIPYYFSKLADRFFNYNYLAYECQSQSFFTLGNAITLKIFSQKVEIINNGKITIYNRKQNLTTELRFYINNYLQQNRRIFGWVNFDFGVELLNLHQADKNDLLAVFFVPECEVQFINNNEFLFHGKNFLLPTIKEIISDKSNNYQPKKFNIKYQNDEDYKKRVSQAINEIKLNKYKKIILSRKVNIPFAVDFAKTYLNGRLSNNPKRSFILKLDDFSSLGFSPELILKTYGNTKVVTEPLAGTKIFSSDQSINKNLISDLYNDPKEIFEHALSVKLSCEEISKVSQDANAIITDFMSVKHRGAVQHLASKVEGILATNKDCFDALEILFPAVTATGIPKKESIASMLHLDEMPRGLYSGGIGFIDLDNSLELTLALRTLFQLQGELFIRVGAGIVISSNPERELEETNEKLSSIAPYIIKK